MSGGTALGPPFLTAPVARHERRVAERWGGRHLFRDRRPPGPGDVNLMSNDYLSLADHPHAVAAQVDELTRHGNGPMMSAAFLTRDDPALAFEQRMAGFLDAEAVVLCQSGWAANTGLVQALAGPDVPVYVDSRAHASLYEGALSARATCRRFRHNDLGSLDTLVTRHGPGLILVDTVYSAHGDLCPLPGLVALAERHGCPVVADESHSLGTHGPDGRGLVAALGLTGRVAFRTASLSKAFSSRAGIVACPRGFAEYFPYSARPAVFSSSVLPPDVAQLNAVLDLVLTNQWRRDALFLAADRLRDGLTALGYDVSPSASQIIALQPGPEERLMVLREALDERGVYGAPFTTPAVPVERTVLRLSVPCTLTDERIERVLHAAAEIRDLVDPDQWPTPR